MPASKSSASSPRSSAAQLAGVLALLAVISATAASWCFARGYSFYSGDAEAHWNIARRILDSRTPGGEQFGTVWLPLPHALMLPLALHDAGWRKGWAGVIPSAVCFVLAGAFLFAAVRRLYTSAAAGLTAALLFACNPNMLYLQATPMTEAVFAAALAALLWTMIRYRDAPSFPALLLVAAASTAASLTRYEGWFLIPFTALYVFWIRRGHGVIFAALAALGPLAWLAHNQYYYSNWLEFYNGEYSAGAIYARQLAQGVPRYPGDHDWRTAVQYYFAAMKMTEGMPLLIAGTLGAAAAVAKKAWWPVFLLALPAAFYVWSIHSSGTPLYVPGLWPNQWYNTRYALAGLPFCAVAAAALAALPRGKAQWGVAALLIAGTITSSAFSGVPVTWKESAVNSAARRNWTQQTADYLAAHYRAGDGIFYSFGDLAGVLRAAGIPLREGLHQGNHPAWDAATLRPDLFLHEEWAIVIAGDATSATLLRTRERGPHYELKKRIIVEGAPPVEIYQRRRPESQ